MNRPLVIVPVLVLVAGWLQSLIFMIPTSHVTEVHAGAQMVVTTLGLRQDAARHVTTSCPLVRRDRDVDFSSCALFS